MKIENNMAEPTTNQTMPNMNELMQKAQEIQQKMKWAQAELGSVQVTGTSGGNMVQVCVNGRREVISVTIDDSALKESKKVLEDLVAAATNDALRKAEKVAQEKMMQLAKDFGLPQDMGGGDTGQL